MSDSELSRAIAELARKTYEDEIKWTAWDTVPETLTRGSNDIIDIMYSTHYQNRNFRIFQRRYQVFNDWGRISKWETDLVLELYDSFDRTSYKFPFVAEIYALWDAIQAKNSGVGDLINQLSGSAHSVRAS